nr:methyltransferase domain-containing protein [Motiliproteus sp. SC1-56]
MASVLKAPGLRILDAGGGLGQMSRWAAELGHRVTLCDHSQAMLEQAVAANEAAGLGGKIHIVRQPLVEFCTQSEDKFDLVLCHAVLEWVENGPELVAALQSVLAPTGTLSLMFYNRHSLVLRNALRGNFRRVMQGDWEGNTGGLTPAHPREPKAVYRWLEELGLRVDQAAGVRCFYDYLPRKVQQTYAFDDILALERAHRHQAPYLEMARYIHLLATQRAR